MPATADAQRLGFHPQRLERLTTHLQQHYVAPGKLAGCQLLVARHGELAYQQQLGQRDLERGLPLQADTLFRIYSMTKPITSVALMQLHEQGCFQLNDPISRYAPQFEAMRVWISGEGDNMVTEPARRPITFRQVLNHSAGFTYGGGLDPVGTPRHPVDAAYAEVGVPGWGKLTLEQFGQRMAQVPLRYQPGERWMYSLATDLCGYLVQAISGQPFDQYLQQHILGPLGMVDTGFQVRPEQLPRFAACYTRTPDKALKLMDDPQKSSYARTPMMPGGGGGLVSTLADYWRFCEMLRRGGELDGVRIIGPRTLRMMGANHLPGGKDLASSAIGLFSETLNEGAGFGLGLATTLGEVASGNHGPGDWYWGGMASTVFWVDPAEDLVVIFMTQLVPSNTFNFRGQLKNIVYGALER
jgi:CubicO group peptidase (beta-lactamase class C family)